MPDEGSALPEECGQRSSITAWDRGSLALLLVILGLVLVTYRDYGLTWDEQICLSYGEDAIGWYLGTNATDFENTGDTQVFHGAFVHMLLALAWRAGDYEARHLVTGLVGVASFALAIGLGRWLFASPAAGFLSGLILLLTPGYYGHLFSNPKDPFFAFGYLLSIALIIGLQGELPRLRMRSCVALAAAIGLTLAVRMGGLLLFVYLVSSWALWLLTRSRETGEALMDRALGRDFIGSLVIIVGGAWLLMVALWPWALQDPIRHPWRAFRATSSFVWPMTVLFEGQQIQGFEIPRRYLPVWLSIRLPDVLLLMLALGAAAGLTRARRLIKSSTEWNDPQRGVVILLLSALFPIAHIVATRFSMYDGMRHLLFVLPPLAILAAGGTLSLLQMIKGRRLRLALGLVLALGLGDVAVEEIRLHPYQQLYFNRLVAGGLKGAAERFETDYWGLCYKEATAWVIRDAKARGGKPRRIAFGLPSFLGATYIERDPEARRLLKVVRQDQHPEIWVSGTRFAKHLAKPGRILHVVKRRGAALCYVIEVENP